jgi:putative membrane protein
MFINYLTLALLAAAATLALGAWFLLRNPAEASRTEDHTRGFAWAFGAAGALLAIMGFHISLTWPIPGAYNIVFGEPLAYFGTLLVIGAPALGFRQNLMPLLVLGAFGALSNLVLAAAIIRFGMTRSPGLGAAMYLTSGLGLLILPGMFRSAAVRKIAAALFAISAALFALTGCLSYLEHPGPEAFGKWVPIEMRRAQ